MATSITLTTNSASTEYTLATGGRGPVGPSPTVVDAVTNGDANAVSSNAVFDALALKAPLISPTFTDDITVQPPGFVVESITLAPNPSTGFLDYATPQGGHIRFKATYADVTVTNEYTFPDATGTIALTSDITGTNSGTNTGDETAARIATALNAGTQDTVAADTDKLAVTHPAGGWMLLSTLWTWITGKIDTLAKLDAIVADATLARTDAGQTFAGAQAFSSTTRPTSSGTGTPEATSLMTQKDVDDDRLDTTKIVFWDDFFGGTDAATIFGQMQWLRSDINGTGTLRPNQIPGQFGAPALVTAATRRAGQIALLDGSNVVGSPGFYLSQIQSTGTKIKFRFRITSLDCRVDIGFATPVPTGAVYTHSRVLVVNYTKKPAQWVGSTPYTTGDYVVPTVSNGRRYYASTGGTTSGSEPTWPTSGTVADGSVTWTEAGYEGSGNFVLMFRSSGADSASTIVSTGTAPAINTWYDVACEFTTATNLAVSINGGSATNITTTSTLASITPVLHVETTTASAAELCVDYFGFVARVTR